MSNAYNNIIFFGDCYDLIKKRKKGNFKFVNLLKKTSCYQIKLINALLKFKKKGNNFNCR